MGFLKNCSKEKEKSLTWEEFLSFDGPAQSPTNP